MVVFLFVLAMILSATAVLVSIFHLPFRQMVHENFQRITYLVHVWVFFVAVLIVKLRPETTPEPEWFDLYSVAAVVWVLVTVISFMLFIRKK